MKKGRLEEVEIESKLTKILEVMYTYDMINDIGLDQPDGEIFERMGWPCLLNIYCSAGKAFEPVYVKGELKDLGFSPAAAHKIYFYFYKLATAE